MFNPNGSRLVYSTYLPSLSSIALALDSHNNIYVAGAPTNPQNETIRPTPGAFQTKPTSELFLKMRPGGTTLIYATYLGDSSTSTGGIAADASGNLYVTGTASTALPLTAGAFQTKFPTELAVTGFVAKLNASGTGLMYATYLGGVTSLPRVTGACNSPSALRLAPNGDVWIGGFTCMSDFPTTVGSLPVPSGAASTGAAFLARMNSTGTALVYSTLVPNSTSTEITGLSLDLDAAGRVYLLSPADYGFPVTPGAFQACTSGFADMLALQFGPTGHLTGGSYLGGAGLLVGPVLAAGGGSVYISSQAPASDNPILAESGIPANETVSFILKILIDNPKQKDGLCVSPRIQNAANLGSAPMVPGEIILLNGYAIGPDAPVSYQVGPDGKVTTALAGVKVLIDGKPAPLLSVQSKQIAAIVPWQLSNSSSVTVQVTYNGVSTDAFQISVAPATPGIFILNAMTGQAAVLNEDGTLNSISNPAKAGSVIAMCGTGGGPMTSIPEDGSFTPLTPPYPLLTLPVQVTLDRPATVLYAGAAPTLVSGVIQINARLPSQTHGQATVRVTEGDPSTDLGTQTQFFIWIQ